ncbi:MAG: YdbH domain-containing protein [Mariprofundus sp.]
MLTRRTVLWLTFVVLLIPALYVSLPGLVAGLLSSQLSAAGYSHNSIHISSLKLNSAVLDSMQMTADDGSLHINIKGLHLSWALSELLDGHIESIKLAELALVIQAAQDSSQATRLPAPAAILAMIPAQRVRVDQFHIELPEQHQHISGRLDYNDGLLQAPLLLDTGAQQFHMQTTIKQDGGVRFILESQADHADIASLAGTLTREDESMHFNGRLLADYARLWPLFHTWLPGEKTGGTIDAVIALAWPAELPEDMAAFFAAVSGKVRVTTDFRAEQVGSARRVSLHGGLSLLMGDGRCEVHVDKALKTAAYWPGITAPVTLRLPAGLNGSIARDGQGLAFTLPGQQAVGLGALAYAGFGLPDSVLLLDQPLRFSYRPAGGWQLEGAGLSVAKQSLQWGDTGLTHQGIRLVLNSDQRWRLRLHGVALRTDSTLVRAVDMDANLRIAHNKLTGRYTLTGRDGLLHLSGRVEHHLDSGRGLMAWSVKSMDFGDKQRLSGWLKLPSAVDVEAGRLSITASSRWRRHGTSYRLNHHINVDAQGISGSLGEGRFTGFSTRLSVAGSDVLKTGKPARMTLDAFDNGVSVKNIGLTVRLKVPLNARKPVFYLDEGSAQMLGGKLTVAAIALDLNRKRNAFKLKVEHLDLGPILALEQQQGLSGSGLLDGTIPMTLTQNGVTVAQGSLSARVPGGVIRYTGNDASHALAAGNSKMDLVLGIFRDFHYDQMDVAADYGSDGGLKMGVRLAGKNPAYANGRAVVFNLNLEENVLKLLESLRVDSAVSKKIDKRVQQRLKK